MTNEGYALNIAGFVVGVLGLAVGIGSFIYALYVRKQSRSIRWVDLSAAAKTLSLSMRNNFTPDVIYAPTQKSGIILELMQPYFKNYIPIIMGLGIPKRTNDLNKAQSNILNADDYYQFETSKWYAYVPKSITAYKNKKVLIVDDFAMSGAYLKALKECFEKQAGFTPQNVKSACLVATTVAERDDSAPDYSWKTIDSAIVYLPWGRPQ